MKPKSRPTRRQARRAKYRKDRKPAREAAFNRDRGRCRWPTCRSLLALESDNTWALAHGHEIAGGRSRVDPTDQNKVVTVCYLCHSDLHVRIGGKRKRIEGDDASGALKFYERPYGKGDWMEVGPDPIAEAEHE